MIISHFARYLYLFLVKANSLEDELSDKDEEEEVQKKPSKKEAKKKKKRSAFIDDAAEEEEVSTPGRIFTLAI